jgi:ABC-type antimicrobial peptide transport system permease subunit
MREVVRSADPGQPVSDLKTMDQRVVLSLGPRRSAVALLAVFAALAMILSGVGLFGLVRYSVGQRTREFGIRAALGASSLDLLRMVLGQGLRLAILGAAAGLVGAATLSRVLQSLLYGVSPIDPVIFAAVTLMLILVALVACWLPARRAMRINPMEALRHE